MRFAHAAEDLIQAAAVIATVVYQAANHKEILPRREWYTQVWEPRCELANPIVTPA
jgi:hypothetical protein